VRTQDLPTSPPRARLLDLSRLISRVGRHETGIDRVERAYLKRLQDQPEPLWALVKLRERFYLFDRAGAEALAARLTGSAAWGPLDAPARLRQRLRRPVPPVETDLRHLARGWCYAPGLKRLLRRHLRPGTAWINVGQVNLLERRVFDAIHAIPGGRAHVMIHDVIPLVYEGYKGLRGVELFRDKVALVSARADLVVCNSEATRREAAAQFSARGRVPPMLTAHLGIDLPQPDRAALPPGFDTARPWFIALGTIERRKNHALLLDIWEHFAATLPPEQIPALVIAGQRGWANDDLFERLDASPLTGRHVFEFNTLGDGAVAALVEGARALLMPSIMEGYGLPVAEALALGTPVLANDLPVYREAFGNNPVYADIADMYSWAKKILEFAEADTKGQRAAGGAGIQIPTWQEHFNLVLKVT